MAPITKPKPVLGPTFLKKWRESAEIGQQAAADAINVSRELLSKMENSKSPYLQQHLEGLAKLYKCRPADLIGSDPALRDPEKAIRSALLSYGVDAADLPAVMKAISGFVSETDDGQ